ncbi:MAG: sulfotransferase [Rhodovibrionaceae bacterium]
MPSSTSLDSLPRDPFFVMGFLKSGTTWLQLLLDAHPEIACKGEAHFWDSFFEDLMKSVQHFNRRKKWLAETTFQGLEPFPGIAREDVGAIMRLVVARVLTRAARGKAAKLYGEKTPNTIHYIEPALTIFPEARFLHIVRDGRDAAVSCWFHYRRVKAEQVQQRWSGSFAAFLETSAQQWAQETAKGRAAAARWPGRVIELRYEDLLAEPEQTLGRLTAFLEVDSKPETLRACLAAADFAKLSGGREAGEEDTGSFFRKGVAGDWRQHFDAGNAARFEALAGAQLRAYGYEAT